MKHYINILYFVLAILLFLFIIEYRVRTQPNEYTYKYNYIEENIEKIDILCLGASVGRTGVNPSYLSSNAFNICNVSQDLLIDCAIINKYIDRADSLKTIIISCFPISFGYKMSNSKEKWRLRKYHLYMHLDVEEPDLLDNLEISNMNACRSQFFKSFSAYNTIECYKNGMGTDSIMSTESEKENKAKATAEMHNLMYSNNCESEIFENLTKTLARCKERDIKVYIIMLPAYKKYMDHIDSYILKTYNKKCSKLESLYSNVKCVNFLNDHRFVSEDFRDCNHLGPSGAKKMTVFLYDLIQK